MADLLIHSMSEFSELILGALALAGAREIVEIGAEYGGMSAELAAYCKAQGGRLTSIDPGPKPEFRDWLAAHPEVRHLATTSLEAFGQPGQEAGKQLDQELGHVDAWMIDGDHNWYTVYHELVAIESISRRDGKPMLAFLHDIAWPAARRDMYYAPERIPADYRHPHSYDAGAKLGSPDLINGRGFRGMGHFAFATVEGGPRNGVLTAVEDFMARALQSGREFGFAEIPAVFGLGVLFDMDAAWSAPLAELLLPFHQNKLLRTLEDNRLRNYLQVIEMQDEAVSRVAR